MWLLIPEHREARGPCARLGTQAHQHTSCASAWMETAAGRGPSDSDSDSDSDSRLGGN